MVTGAVTTLHSAWDWLFDLALAPMNDGFYVTAGHGIIHIRNDTETWLVGSRLTGRRNGNFSTAQFDTPIDLEWLDSSTLLVADRDSDSIKVIDLESKQVQQICTGQFVYSSFFIKEF